jgi:toxin HigB-1
MVDIFVAELSERAKKDLIGLPEHIISKLESWVAAIRRDGWREVKKIPGYHDEPLKGKRFGQRSIRLNRAYRAIYIKATKKMEKKEIEILEVEEVSKHEY